MKPIYEPKGAAREYGELALNIYTGCPHECFYCFAPGVLHRTKAAFHLNVEPRDGIVEALTLCDNTPGPVARILGAGILAHQRGDEDIRRAIDEAALEELPKLERHIRMFGTLCYIMPLLGLLGTVLGMLGAFESIGAAGNFTTEAVSHPVWQALLTTAAGLTITIPCHVGYNYLVGRVESMTLDMEKAALELTSFFERSRQNSTGQKK